MILPAAKYRIEVRRGPDRVLEAVQWVTVMGWDESVAAQPEVLKDFDRETCFRSGCKPFQVLPLIERGHAKRFGFGPREIAVMSASHSGTAMHVEIVRGILNKIGLKEGDLLCGFHYPYDNEAKYELARSGAEHTPIYNNCSGKHAGMLALALAEGWPTKNYTDADHPVQATCVAAVTEMCDVSAETVPLVVDGCSAINPSMPLSAMARGFARFASAREGGETARERALAEICQAMQQFPEVVAGEGRLCTDLVRATAGKMAAKTGAEGLECVAIPSLGTGVVAKVEDGSERAKAPALLDFLSTNEFISSEEVKKLQRWHRPILKNHRDKSVGEIQLVPQRHPANSS